MSTDHAANISLFIAEYIWLEKAFKLYCEEERREVRMFLTVNLCVTPGRTRRVREGFPDLFFLLKRFQTRTSF